MLFTTVKAARENGTAATSQSIRSALTESLQQGGDATVFLGETPDVCFTTKGLTPSMNMDKMSLESWEHFTRIAMNELQGFQVAGISVCTNGEGEKVVDVLSVRCVPTNGDAGYIGYVFEKALSDALADAWALGAKEVCVKVGNDSCTVESNGKDTREAYRLLDKYLAETDTR